MIDLKKELLSIKGDFIRYKTQNEKIHKYFLLIYFTPPLLLIVVLFFFSKQSFENIYVKVAIFFTIVLGVGLHFFFRRLFEGEKLKNRDFILSKLKLIETSFGDLVIFKSKLTDTIREILQDDNLEYSYASINNDVFWKIIFTEFDLSITRGR